MSEAELHARLTAMHQELEEMSADIKRADAEDAAFAQEMTASLARIGQMFHAALHPEEPS